MKDEFFKYTSFPQFLTMSSVNEVRDSDFYVVRYGVEPVLYLGSEDGNLIAVNTLAEANVYGSVDEAANDAAEEAAQEGDFCDFRIVKVLVESRFTAIKEL